ncbi:MAG: CDP-glycerol glycerophosphotransferase family protein [Lachnospiraceae bacterium]|nr:CDP-glycerol glycerophosphotransferase family protein [Lachnospiraceae bacterium]
MDVKAVTKNLITKGPRKTYKIYKSRNKKADITQGEQNSKIKALEKQVEELKRQAMFVQLEKEICDLLKLAEQPDTSAVIRKSIYEVIKEKEKTRWYRTYLKRKYIKSVLPSVYNAYKVLPIEDKMIFMQPRKGLNQSCRYMYHTIEKQGKYKPILYELDRDNVPSTQYYLNAVEWIKALATSKACFVHESNDLMGYLDIRPETKIVQLWHGCGILKKIGLSTADMKTFKSSATYREFPEYNKYDIVTTASPELTWVFEEFMGIDRKEGIIQPIGVSRTDEFFNDEYVQNCYKKIHEKVPASLNKKIILYAPTYRGVGQQRIAPDQLDIKQFAENLGDEYILIIKQHQTVKELPPIPEEYKNKFAYDMTRGWGMDINELMTVSDICISDYSSLIFEFALFERPIMFYVYDLEDYIDERGLYYDFNETSPGPICKTNEEMIDYIKNIEERFDKKEIADFKYKFMRSCDGHATERILNYIEGE